jgi:hypothetical protein
MALKLGMPYPTEEMDFYCLIQSPLPGFHPAVRQRICSYKKTATGHYGK